MSRDDLSTSDVIEGRDVRVARVAWIGLGIGGVVLLAVAVVFTLLHAWRLAPGGESDGAARVGVIPAPRLQTAPQPEYATHRAADARAVQAIGIDAAMAAVVASGAGR